MRTKRKAGVCVYCGQWRELSRDHVIPLCLFTKPYPPNLITVPACDECNNEKKSGDDDFLRDYLAVDVQGSESPMAQALFGKLQRSLDRNSSDLLRQVLPAARVEPFFTEAGLYLGDLPQAPIDLQRLERIFGRIVRGLYFDALKLRIPENYKMVLRRSFPWQYQALADSWTRLKPHGPRRLGDVFEASYLRATEDHYTTRWIVCFYQRVVFSVWTSAPD